MITDIKGLEYGGRYHKFFWDVNINPLATIQNALANCTCFVIGDIQKDGLPVPVSNFVNASNWHKYVTNGWRVVDYDKSKVELGDIIEWTDGCHVARVTNITDDIYISGSFYTGEHGKSMYQGKFDTRDSFKSLQELSDFMITNYPVRFFHYWSLENECNWVGYQPRYIIKQPKTINPVQRDTTVNQIEVLTDEQFIRNRNNIILGVAKKGYYNVLSIVHSTKNEYDWYEVDDDMYIAGVDGRVKYLPLTSNEIERLRKQVDDMRRDYQEIYKIIARWI